MALLRATAGTARSRARCVARHREIKRQIGYLPGELSLDPRMTGGQILTCSRTCAEVSDPTYVVALVSRLDIDTSRRFGHYSHGNKQKMG